MNVERHCFSFGGVVDTVGRFASKSCILVGPIKRTDPDLSDYGPLLQERVIVNLLVVQQTKL